MAAMDAEEMEMLKERAGGFCSFSLFQYNQIIIIIVV